MRSLLIVNLKSWLWSEGWRPPVLAIADRRRAVTGARWRLAYRPRALSGARLGAPTTRRPMRLTIMITNLINLMIGDARRCCAGAILPTSRPNSATPAGALLRAASRASPAGCGARLHQALVRGGGGRTFSIDQDGPNICLRRVIAAGEGRELLADPGGTINETCLRSW
jgi:hypothetical protein